MFSQELLRYVKENSGQKPPEAIKEGLLKDGWQAAAIEEAFLIAQKESQPDHAKAKKPKPLKLWLILGLFCLALAAVASFFYSRGSFCPGTHQIRLVLYIYSIAAILIFFLLLAWLMPKLSWPHNRALKILGFIFFVLLFFNLFLFLFYILLLLGEGALQPEQAIAPYFMAIFAAAVSLPLLVAYLIILAKKYFRDRVSLDKQDKFFFVSFIFFWVLVFLHLLAGGYAGLVI